MGQHRKRGKSAKKARAAMETKVREEAYARAPHTFVYHRGQVGKNIRHLVKDCRRIFEPYTATKLKVTKSNSLRDLVQAASCLHVTHFLCLTKTDLAPYLRIMCAPKGPTLTFKMVNYCLSRDVLSSLRRPDVEQSVYQTAPLLVMNNLSGADLHIKLMATVFQNMLPSIDVHSVKLKTMRRALLIHMDKDSQMLQLRHYLIRVAPTGINKTTRKLLSAKIPNLSRFSGIEEFVEMGGNLSESEGEMDGPHNEVVLPQDVRGRGNVKTTQSAIRLKEVGPRLQLQLVKIEEGLGGGAVLHHSFVTKTPEEAGNLKAMVELKRKLKAQRTKRQERNVKRKAQQHQTEKDGRRKRSVPGVQRKRSQPPQPRLQESSDDDEAYFKQEVGKAPDKDVILPRKRKHVLSKKGPQEGLVQKKRRRK